MRNLTHHSVVAATLVTLSLLVAAPAAGHGDGHGDTSLTIQSVLPDSPAAKAGLDDGDRILRLDGQEIKSQDDLKSVMASHRPGDTVPLVVEREGEQLDLELTFDERSGGVSIGISYAVMASPDVPTDEGLTRDACLSWVDDTYRLDALTRELGLDLGDSLQELGACTESNMKMMPSTMPQGWCDNIFKIHCSGLDALTEIGEALVDRCADLLGTSLDVCTSNRVFDRYSRDGDASDEAACRAARDACAGTQ